MNYNKPTIVKKEVISVKKEELNELYYEQILLDEISLDGEDQNIGDKEDFS